MGAHWVVAVRLQVQSHTILRDFSWDSLQYCCGRAPRLQKAMPAVCVYWNLRRVSSLYRVNFNQEKPDSCAQVNHGFNAVLTNRLLRSFINRVQVIQRQFNSHQWRTF
jgi:hypothetical protein